MYSLTAEGGSFVIINKFILQIKHGPHLHGIRPDTETQCLAAEVLAVPAGQPQPARHHPAALGEAQRAGGPDPRVEGEGRAPGGRASLQDRGPAQEADTLEFRWSVVQDCQRSGGAAADAGDASDAASH